jgi:hypothetical protein
VEAEFFVGFIGVRVWLFVFPPAIGTWLLNRKILDHENWEEKMRRRYHLLSPQGAGHEGPRPGGRVFLCSAFLMAIVAFCCPAAGYALLQSSRVVRAAENSRKLAGVPGEIIRVPSCQRTICFILPFKNRRVFRELAERRPRLPWGTSRHAGTSDHNEELDEMVDPPSTAVNVLGTPLQCCCANVGGDDGIGTGFTETGFARRARKIWGGIQFVSRSLPTFCSFQSQLEMT